MSGFTLSPQSRGPPADGGRGQPAPGARPVRVGNSGPSRLFGTAVLISTMAPLSGPDYALAGVANQAEMGKIRYIGRPREWAIAAAIVLAFFAALSWTSTLYFAIFLAPALAFAVVAVILHFARPVVEIEERETKTGNSRRVATKYPPP
jgi:hypothetical protein